MTGSLRVAALLLLFSTACSFGDDEEETPRVCDSLPDEFCRGGEPLATRCWYGTLAFCSEYIPNDQVVAEPNEAKRLCEEVPYRETTGRFEIGECPREAIGRCETEAGYIRHDYHYAGWGGLDDNQIASVASTVCSTRPGGQWEDGPF